MPFTDGMSVVRRDGNAGLVTTTGGGAGFEDTLHTLPGGRSARITKITAYNNTGGNVPLLIGTMDRNPLGAAFSQLLTTIVAINAIESVWLKEELPVSTARMLVKSVQSPIRTTSTAPVESKPTLTQGVGSSQLGLAASALGNTSTTTVPARTGRWLRVPVTLVSEPLMVASSPLTSCEE